MAVPSPLAEVWAVVGRGEVKVKVKVFKSIQWEDAVLRELAPASRGRVVAPVARELENPARADVVVDGETERLHLRVTEIRVTLPEHDT